jgi:putative sigma-54 modulation protein
MNINIESLKFKTDSKLVDFINEKVLKLTTFNSEIINADIVLNVEKNDEKENKVVDITLELRGHKLFASKQSKSFEDATLDAVDALKSQLLKLKKD